MIYLLMLESFFRFSSFCNFVGIAETTGDKEDAKAGGGEESKKETTAVA